MKLLQFNENCEIFRLKDEYASYKNNFNMSDNERKQCSDVFCE